MMFLTLLLACAQPTHLQYDFGRAFNDTLRLQGDLTRASVADDAYTVEGSEALLLRENQRKAMAQKTTGTPQATDSVKP